MNRAAFWITSVMLAAILAVPCLGQEGPRPPRDGGGDEPGPGMRGGGGMMGGRGMNQPGGPGGPDGGRPMMRGPEAQKFEMLRQYIDVVDRFAKMTHDASAAGVAAVVSASDILRQRGPESAIEYFNKILPEVPNKAVQRAIRIQLVDLYKQSGQADKALEQLDILIKGAPAE